MTLSPLILAAALSATAAKTGQMSPTSDVSSNRVKASGSTTYRSNAERWADVVSVKDYGATGDYVTDDTAAILLATSVAVNTYKPLYFPQGAYKITQAIPFQGEVFGPSRRYQGATLYPQNCAVFDTSGNNPATMGPLNRTRIHDFRIDASAITTTIPVINIQNTYGVEVSDIFLDGYAQPTTAISINTANEVVIDRLIAGYAGGTKVGSIAVNVNTASATISHFDIEGWQVGINCAGGTSGTYTLCDIRGGYTEANTYSVNAQHGVYGHTTVQGTALRTINSQYGVRITGPHVSVIAPRCETQGTGGACVVVDVMKDHGGAAWDVEIKGVDRSKVLDVFNVGIYGPNRGTSTTRRNTWSGEGTFTPSTVTTLVTTYMRAGASLTGSLHVNTYNATTGLLASHKYGVTAMRNAGGTAMSAMFTPDHASTVAASGGTTWSFDPILDHTNGAVSWDITMAGTTNTASYRAELDWFGAQSVSVY